jgi:VanZ family protein
LRDAMPPALAIAYRLASIGTLVALAVLSLLPAGSLQRTELGGHTEHVLAYAGTALVIALGLRADRHRLVLLGLTSYAGLLEFLQTLAPGRSTQLRDFVACTAGIIVGLLMGRVLHLLLRRWLGGNRAPRSGEALSASQAPSS